jgi:hypothetical protein
MTFRVQARVGLGEARARAADRGHEESAKANE